MNGSTKNDDDDPKIINKCPICDNPADKLCSGCRSVYYCSSDHQKQHWKKVHKQQCRNWVIRRNEILGRYVVATRDIEPGTVIFDEEAIVIGPKFSSPPVCLGCYAAVNGSYFCSKCDFPVCNKKCEQEPHHAENECLLFRKKRVFPNSIDFSKHHPIYECLFAIRSLRLKDLHPQKWEQLQTFEHHNGLRKSLRDGQLWLANESNVVQFLRKGLDLQDVDPLTIHTVLGYAHVNSFEIRQDKSNCPTLPIAGLYNNIVLMAHDCIPNTTHIVIENYRMIVRASVPIKRGEMITTTYANTLEGTMARRKVMRFSKLFDCSCARCTSGTEMDTNYSSVVCPSCSKGYLTPVKPLNDNSAWNCSSCAVNVQYETIEEILKNVKKEIENAEKGGNGNVIELLEALLKKYSGKVLHPNHHILIRVCLKLSQLYGRGRGWKMEQLGVKCLKRKEEICRHLLEVLDVLEPGLSKIRGATLFELHQAIKFRVQKQRSSGDITKEKMTQDLLEVLDLLKTALQIFSFESPTSNSAKLAKEIPSSVRHIKDMLKKHCSVNID